VNIARAPVYVRASDLTLDLMARCEKLPRSQRPVLGDRIQLEAIEVLNDISTAILFPEERAEHLMRADKSLLRLRLAVRLAGDRQLFGEREMRFVMERIDVIGRMIGGWRRQTRRSKGEGPSTPDGGELGEEALEPSPSAERTSCSDGQPSRK